VCDENELSGCQDSVACNFNPSATDSGGCVYPIAEICNQLDDDCDGTVDNGLVYTQWYQDMDLDGFGAAWMGYSCADPPVGWVTDSTDCDDADALINPTAVEVNDNGVDENCDGNLGLFVSENLQGNFHLFPNPLNGDCVYLTSNHSSVTSASMVIYNMQGQMIMEQTWRPGECIPLDVPSGVYQVVVKYNDGSARLPLVIVK
jgi:hypothetical protein